MNATRWNAELVGRAREARTIGEFREQVLKVLRAVVPYDRAVFTEYCGHEPIMSVNVDAASLQLIRYCESNYQRYALELRRCFQMVRHVGGCLDIDLYSSRERRELPLFREVIQPQHVRSTIVLTPRWHRALLGMIRLERVSAPHFLRCDLDRAIALLPAVEVGLRAHHAPALAASRPAHAASRGGDTSLPRLGMREAEVAHQVARGLTTPQIAVLLGTSPLTVRNQICRIFDKVGVASRAELASWMARHATPPMDGAVAPYLPVNLVW
jgi:DNA-binding CsgD family transcriptional regulator